MLTFTTRADLDTLARLLMVDDITGFVCMCHGDAAFELLDGVGARIDVVGWHFDARVRWGGWESDASLAHAPELISWLAERGFTPPAERAQRLAEQRAARQDAEHSWKAAAPACARDLVPQMLRPTSSPFVDDDVVGEVRRRLHDAHPRQRDRARVLLRWRAGGSGRYSGYPIHEQLPDELLVELPLSAILAAVDGLPRTDPAWTGAAWHLLSRSRSLKQLQRVPASVWDEIARVTQAHDDRAWSERHRSTRRQIDHANEQRATARRPTSGR
ncbi:hypothetical protein GCM10027059_46810 [Myceligenerans halotolerans]